MKYQFEYTTENNIPWEVLENCYDHTVFKSKGWSDFLLKFYGVKPFVVSVQHKDNIIGYFYGQQIKRFGIKIIASPFEGWATSFQGLSMLNELSVNQRLDIYEDLIKWLFSNKYCCLFQVSDWQLELAECLHRNMKVEITKGYVLDLAISEDELYKNTSYSGVRYCINRAKKRGITISESDDGEKFSYNYYNQLKEVFELQGLTPSHSEKHTHTLINCNSEKQILALCANDKDGNCIASAYFPYTEHLGVFLGGASYNSSKKDCPNEPLMWEAIKKLKEKGVRYLEFGGGRRYKEKYGPTPYVKPKIIAEKYRGLLLAKNIAKYSFYRGRDLFALIKGKKTNKGLSKN